MPSLETNQLLRAAAGACDSRKAEDIRILALDPTESSLTDYFLICSGTNERQNVAISDEIELRLKQEFNTYPNSVEGRRQGEWVLMDYVDFVVHIFMPEKRAYYGLEQLRKSATTLTLDDLNSEIKAALTATRAKRSTIKKTESEAPVNIGSGPVAGKEPLKAKKTLAKVDEVSAGKAAKKSVSEKKQVASSKAKKVAAEKKPKESQADLLKKQE